MKQYHDLLQLILDKGTWKDAARENMPRTKALFGHQMRFDLSKGFPMVNTKNVSFKNIVVELLWFLKGDTNIKYLVDNGCNIWNEDAYNYYCKIASKNEGSNMNSILKGVSLKNETRNPLKAEDIDSYSLFTFEEFIDVIKNNPPEYLPKWGDYVLGSCGKQYGWLWRKWAGSPYLDREFNFMATPTIDQISTLIKGLKISPEGRRHILTAWNPATLNDMALNACHVLAQFNCRKLTIEQKYAFYKEKFQTGEGVTFEEFTDRMLQIYVPEYYLDCQLYQRSADSLLGVPYNIASYALLTEMLCQMLNFVPGDFIHTFGDVHIYENHISAVKEQLSRDLDKYPLSKLKTNEDFKYLVNELNNGPVLDLDTFWEELKIDWFKLENYQHYPKLENDTSLSTGLKK